MGAPSRKPGYLHVGPSLCSCLGASFLVPKRQFEYLEPSVLGNPHEDVHQSSSYPCRSICLQPIKSIWLIESINVPAAAIPFEKVDESDHALIVVQIGTRSSCWMRFCIPGGGRDAIEKVPLDKEHAPREQEQNRIRCVKRELGNACRGLSEQILSK